MRRSLRLAWVFLVNGLVLALTVERLSPALSDRAARDLELWTEIALEVCVPILGIVSELVRWKSAHWINVGYLTLGGCFWLGEALRWRSDPFFGVLLLFSLGMFILAGLTQVIYRRTNPEARAQLSSS